MSLGIFIAITIGGALAGLVARRWRWPSVGVGLGALVAAVAVAMTIHPGDNVAVAETALVATDYTRLFAILAAATGLVLCLVSIVTEWQPTLPPALLGALGALTVALSALEPSTGVLATIAAGLIAVIVAFGESAGTHGSAAGVRAFRAIVVAGALALVAVLAVDDPIGALAIDPAVLGAAYVVGALAVALRFGAIPFHVWAGRFADAAPEIALPIVLAWSPAALAAVVLTWTDSSISPLVAPLDAERAIVVVLGALTIVLGGFAAWLQDDVEHVVTYSVAQDAGFVLLAFGALDPIAWEPARTWVVILALGKTAFAAWVVALRTAFGSRRLSELAGWAGAAPSLALALAGIAVATVGWPGSAAWSARGELIRAAMSDPIGILVTLGGLSSLLVYGRVLAVGVAGPSGFVRAGASWLPRRPDPSVPAAAATGSPRTVEGRHRLARGGSADEWRKRLRTIDGIVALNRAPITAGLVLVLAALAVSGAAGGLGLPEAARSAAPIAPDTLHPGEGQPSGTETLPGGADSPAPSTTAPPSAGASSPDAVGSNPAPSSASPASPVSPAGPASSSASSPGAKPTVSAAP